MRLRFLRIKNYFPFIDTAINFSAESPLQRQCAIRFVVGVNGTGKTHFIQAITKTFVCMARGQAPHFPVTLIYELGQERDFRTVIFDHPGGGAETGWWESSSDNGPFPASYGEADWQKKIDAARGGVVEWRPLIKSGNWPGKGVGLPQKVLAYTSGALCSWEEVFRLEPRAAEVDSKSQSMDYDFNIERPAGWSRSGEIQHQEQIATEEALAVLKNLREKQEEDSGQERDQEICTFITPLLLKFALLSVSLPPDMEKLRKIENDQELKALFDRIRQPEQEEQGLQRLVSEVDWAWLVTVAFSVDFQPEKWPAQFTSDIKPFFELATSVIREPAPSSRRRLYFDLIGSTPPLVNLPFKKVGDALLDALGGLQSHPFDNFQQLYRLHNQGLIDDLVLTIKRRDTGDVLSFDEMSDGEQVYLGRMALFHLMQGKHDALILLDEPETHFNDKWKREIVDIIDEALKETSNDVLIATHSSIALTDVFNDEIVLFEKSDGTAHLSPITSTTFGADPSEIMINVFKTPDSIGKRSLEWLNAQLEKDWKPEQKAELEKVIRSIGPGLHRSELRTIWRKLNAPQD